MLLALRDAGLAGGKVKFAFIEGPDKMRIEIIEGRASKD